RSNISKTRYQVPFGQITNIQNQSNLESIRSNDRLKSFSPENAFQSLISSHRQAPNDFENQFLTKQFQSNDYALKNSQFPAPLGLQNSNFPSTTNISTQRAKINESKLSKVDVTKDLFNNFEKSTFLNPKKEISNFSLSTIDNNTITEASYVGNVKIHEVNKNGYYIRLLNVSNKYEEDLSNYTIQQMVSSMPVAVFRLPYPTKLEPGHTITIWARTDEVEQQLPHTFVWNEQDKWGTGPECTTVLAKPNGQAVSWTTGCHKYGNIDYDDVLPVYSGKRNRTPVQLDRQKLIPQRVFTPTKHPHGSKTKISDDQNEQEETIPVTTGKSLDTNTGFQRCFFNNQKNRPVNSAAQVIN
ncbi:unnamed protein product, partial [Brachionus calyciflorus]